MDTATLPRPAPPSRFVLQPPAPGTGGRRAPHWRPPRAHLLGRHPHRIALAGILLLCLLVRLWGIKQGLPYSYNSDEAQHFVPRAIAFFSGDWNPHYFLNPPAYSYLLTIVFELWFGGPHAATHAFVSNPTEVFVVARVVAAVLGTLAAGLTYLAGARLFSRGVGLLAAAILGFAFLPVFYSHLALNDVPTLAPVALSLVGIAGVYRRGRAADYLLAGLGIGLAAAAKYTGGITLLCLLAAAGVDGTRRGGATAVLRPLAGGLLVALAAFTIANPYWILDWHGFTEGISDQASLAAGAEPVKLGTTPGGGVLYYLRTFTWGLGWVPAIAALAGAALLLARRRWGLAALFLPAPVAFVLFMGLQQRYFGRWLMPIFPLVAVLGAWAAVELARWARTRRVPIAASGAAIVLALLLQSVLADVHDDRVLSRPDTRALTRAWMVAHIPAGQKIVVEPVVPDNWTADIGHSLPWTRSGNRWYRYPTWLSRIGVNGRPLPGGRRRYVVVDEYERVLRPALLARYEHLAYCWVVVGSLQRGRAFAQPADAPQAIAYYRALDREGTLVHRVSPFARGARPVPFGFDFSIDYLPSAYRLPGPVMSVYRLHGGRCRGSS